MAKNYGADLYAGLSAAVCIFAEKIDTSSLKRSGGNG
jgi:hypothetical protein